MSFLRFDTITFDTTFGTEDEPELWALLTYDDVSDPTPAWTDVTVDVREFSTSRGRDSELSEFSAGTASVTLDNQHNQYDPTTHTYIRPMNQVWLFSQLAGVTESLFKGYVEAYQQQWPGTGVGDAVCVVQAADEFKILAMGALPNMDPPRDTYADVVAYDNPSNYWRWNDSNLTSTDVSQTTEMPTFHWTYNGFEWDTVTVSGTVSGFQDWTSVTGVGFQSSYDVGPIVGDLQGVTVGLGGWLIMDAAFSIKANDITIGDPMGGTAFTFETWFQKTGNPGSNQNVVLGPESTTAGIRTWYFNLNTTGTVAFFTNDSGGTLRSVVSTTALQNNVWYHVVGEADGANLRIFINGVQEATATAGTGSFRVTNTATGAVAQINGVTGVTDVLFDETACYLGVALPAARVLAHYQAGALRGFRGGDTFGLSHLRANQVLDAVTSDAPRNIRVGLRSLLPIFQHGQDPLTELRKCALVEMPNGTLFIAKDGTVTLLDAAHRTVSPWSTSRFTFNDDSTGVFYEDLVMDFSDSFLINEWNASIPGGTLVTSSDATSISRYGKRSQTLSDLPLAGAVGPATITAALLAKYKDPLMRAQSVSFNCSDFAGTDNVLDLELCDRVNVVRHLPGGGVLSEAVYVQKIDVHGSNDQKPWIVNLGLSEGSAPVGG